jgi:hypothetical protein
MLLLFALSVTPKQLLHDTITGHKHSHVKFNGAINYQASKNNFICNWQDDAVESPFTDQPAFQFDHVPAPSSPYINYYTCTFYSAEHSFSSLRGPPALA